LTYNWRELPPDGTAATQTLLAPDGCHPVICVAPEMIGCPPGAAAQTTGWPGTPESAAPNRQVCDKRYVPSASRTVTLVLPAARCDWTADWAAVRLHGAPCEQSPDPVGLAYKVMLEPAAGFAAAAFGEMADAVAPGLPLPSSPPQPLNAAIAHTAVTTSQ
jgi:hypothetical protein